MKRFFCLIISVLCLSFVTACQPTPDKPPVVSKNDGKLEGAINDGANDEYVYQAPESYSKTQDFYDGKLTVTIDENAEIAAKENIKYPVYEVTISDFDQETVKHIANIFFGDAQLKSHISMEDRETKSYIMNELILPNKEKLADLKNGYYDKYFFKDENGIYSLNRKGEKVYEDSGKTMEEVVADAIESLEFLIQSLEKKYKNAPVNVIEASPISLDNYKAGDRLNADIPLSDGRMGRLCVSNNTLTAVYDYVDQEDGSDIEKYQANVTGQIGLLMDSEDDLNNDIPYVGDKEFTQYVIESLDYDKAKNQAIEFVKTLGLDDRYIFAGMGVGAHNSTITETNTVYKEQYNMYGVYFMRPVDDSMCLVDKVIYGIDGIGGTFGGLGGDAYYSEEFNYEKLVVWVDSNGVNSIYWSSPLKIERTLQSSVEITPFETAYQNAEQSVQRNAGINDIIVHEDIKFSKFELGYTMMMEKNKSGYFILVPTWIGHYSISGEKYGDDDKTIKKIPNEVNTVAVNALDGSVINRYLGY